MVGRAPPGFRGKKKKKNGENDDFEKIPGLKIFNILGKGRGYDNLVEKFFKPQTPTGQNEKHRYPGPPPLPPRGMGGGWGVVSSGPPPATPQHHGAQPPPPNPPNPKVKNW